MRRYMALLAALLTLLMLCTSCRSKKGSISTDETTAETGPDGKQEVIRSDLIPFTVTLTRTTYTGQDTKLELNILGKKPGTFQRGDCWELYHIRDGKWELVGKTTYDIIIQMNPPTEDQKVDWKGTISFSMFGRDTLEPGSYCMRFIAEAPSNDGTANTYPAASLRFTVE